jgi:hypothetical protein
MDLSSGCRGSKCLRAAKTIPIGPISSRKQNCRGFEIGVHNRACAFRGRYFGVAALLGASLYRRWLHPDWTGAQALAALWPVYIAGAISVLHRLVFQYRHEYGRRSLGAQIAAQPSKQNRNDATQIEGPNRPSSSGPAGCRTTP